MVHCQTMIYLSTFILLPSIIAALSKYIDEDCERIRRPIHMLSDDELSLYAEGLKAIRRNGKYQYMIDAHQAHTSAHRGPAFFFYHSYFVWEVETQIRALGGKFECFSLPYYDFTIDAGSEYSPFVLSTVFGGNSDPDDDRKCVGGDWNVHHWPLHELCEDDEDTEEPKQGCCLKRDLAFDAIKLSGAVDIGQIVSMDRFSHFRGGVVWNHQLVHWLFARNECPMCAMATGFSPDDPIFMLLHSFTAYLRAIWASCHGYDKIPADELERYDNVYQAECAEGYDECDVVELDGVYGFGEMETQEWSVTSQMDITPRKLWDFADWGVKFDLGTFYTDSKLSESQQLCPSDTILEDNAWLVQLPTDNGRDHNAMNNRAMSQKRAYLDAVWTEINEEYQAHDEKTKFEVLMSLECEFNKDSLLRENQCKIDEASLHIETCHDLKIFDVDELEGGLEAMLKFKGVKSNKCLQNIRKTVINSEFRTNDQLLALCNGEFDYQCPDKVYLKNEYEQEILSVDGENIVEHSAGPTVVFAFVVLSLLPTIFICKQKCNRYRGLDALIDDEKDSYGSNL